MPGTQDQDTVEPLSYTPIGENNRTTPSDTTPTPAPRNINPPSPEVAKSAVSNSLLSTLSQNDETPPPAPPKGQALLDPNTQAPPPSLSQTEGEETHISLSDVQESSGSRGSFDNGSEEHAYAELSLPTSEGSVHGESGKPIYTTTEPNTKSSKKSLESGIGNKNSTLSRSPSQDTVFEDPDTLDLDKTLTRLNEELIPIPKNK